MKALSGYAEWFWLICKGWKDVENRTWPLPHNMACNLPARIYLHASRSDAVRHNREDLDFIRHNLTAEQWDVFCLADWPRMRGFIIGEVTITSHFKRREYRERDNVDIGSQQRQLQLAIANHEPYTSPWFFGPFGYAVRDGALYNHPIPCKGRLGFFEPDIKGAI